MSAYSFLGYDGMVHFVATNGLQTKMHPTDINLYDAGRKIFVYDKNNIKLGSFYK